MILIADSGSTKTDWCLASTAGISAVIQTEGINPVVQPHDVIAHTIEAQFLNKCREMGIGGNFIEAVYFYGAGCLPEFCPMMTSTLRDCLPNAKIVEVSSDLLGACRALCGKHAGVACILGTGANSCFYDGKSIRMHTPALGYILGDEGSGAVLGRNLINGILKGWLPESLRNLFMDEYTLTMEDIINKVYHSPTPNRFLASLSIFIGKHMEYDELQKLVVDNFENFIVKNLRNYSTSEFIMQESNDILHTINAVGSIAIHYKEQLKVAANNCGYIVGKIQKSPIGGLVEYHLQ